ncbi:MAG: hypothetical protein R3B89_06195 [Polyangiaceae bacterium]
MSDRRPGKPRDPAILRSGVRLKRRIGLEEEQSPDERCMPEVSGLALRTLCRSLKQLRGDPCLRRALAELPDDIAAELARGAVRADGWYPLAWLIDLHHVAQRITGVGPELSRTLGYEGSRHNFRGAHRFYVTGDDPSLVLKRAPWVFGLFYRGCGTLDIIESRAGFARARWIEAVAFTDSLWQEQLGSCEAALEASGARRLTCRFDCGGRSGSPVTELLAEWT